jgi:hypothetical protein
MKTAIRVLAILVLTTSATFAQSAGSFNYSTDPTVCTDTSGLLGGGTTKTALTTTMKVSSGSGNAVVIRPSVVTGLLTDVSITDKQPSSFAQAGVNFSVRVTPLSGQPAPAVTPNYAVAYDGRFIQISTNLFQAIGAACTTNVNGCFFNFNETTLSAHSFDWVVTNLTSGNYGITVEWTPHTSAQAPSSALTCVGPLNLTATQVKIFQQNTGISF